MLYSARGPSGRRPLAPTRVRRRRPVTGIMTRPPSSAAGTPASPPVGRYRWVICALLFFATTINYLDRSVLGVLAPTLRAELDCIVAMSACPQDILPINGEAGKPTEAHFEVVG